MGEVYVTQHDPAKPEVYSDMFDEDEDRFFPDIDAAIQGHLAWMTEVDLTPGPRVSRAPRHNMGCGVFKAAFGEVA